MSLAEMHLRDCFPLSVWIANRLTDKRLSLQQSQAQVAANNMLHLISQGADAQLTHYQPFGGLEVRHFDIFLFGAYLN